MDGSARPRSTELASGAKLSRITALNQYCTLFDSNYLPRGLALYRSLERCCEDFVLWVVCMDEESRSHVNRLSLPRMRSIDIAEVERWDSGLRAVRATRSAVEYCWTATPAICRFVLDREPRVEALTYLDADLWFSSSPEPLFTELGDGSILLVPHRASPAQEAYMGTYNVGWVTFRNDDQGRAALGWWRDRCLEWCYDRAEPGRYGDQKYLDDWPERFCGVRVSRNSAAGLAPWNHDRHRITAPAGEPVLVDGKPLIFYHHVGLRLHPGNGLSAVIARGTGAYQVNPAPVRLAWTVVGRHPSIALDLIWTPYVRRLAEALHELRAVGAKSTTGLRPMELHRGAIAQVARQRLPRRVVTSYRRLPLALRHRIWRSLTPR